MGYTITKNQALRFTPLSSCRCGASYCQPVETGDELLLQGTVNAANDNQLVADGDFDASTNWNLGTYWTIAGGKLLLNTAGDFTSTAETISPVPLVAGRTYLIRLSATMSAGVVGPSGWKVSINGHDIPLNATFGGYSHEGITATYVYRPTAITTGDIVFTGSKTGGTEFDVEVAYFEVYEVSQIGLALYDNNNTLLVDEGALTAPNDIKYLYSDGSTIPNNIPTIYEGDYSYNELSFTWQLYISNFASLTNYTGCMVLELYDLIYAGTTERIFNGTFATGDLTGWVVGSEWEYDTGGALYNPPTMGAYTAGTLCQTVYLMGGLKYDFQFFLSAVGLSDTMQVLIDYNDGGGSQQLLIGQGVGLQGAEIDLSALSGVQEITLCFAETEANKDFKVDNVSLLAQDSAVGSYSNCINLQDEHACTLLFRAANEDNAFGFTYTNSGFRQWLRAYAKIKYNEYPEDTNVFTFSDRSKIITFAARDKSYTVTIGDAAEHVHDFLSIARLHDDFRIRNKMEDGTEETIAYVINGSYELGQRKSSNNSTATFNVFEAQGISANYSCE